MAAAVVQMSGLYARDAYGYVLGLELALPGETVGALIGNPQDGTNVLAHLLAGLARPTSGVLTVAGERPFDSPSTRAKIGALLLDPQLPDVGTVRELLAVNRAIRGERTDREPWYDALGIAELSRLRVGALDRRQARAVALGIALSIPSPSLLVLHDPLAEVTRADAQVLRQLLSDRAQEGACVLVLTSSAADAAALADDVATLQRGHIGRAIGAPDVDEMARGATLEVRVWTNKPREVAAGLALEPSAESVWVATSQKGSPIAIQTSDVEACARAVARVIAEQDAELVGLQTTMPGAAQVHEATLRMIARAGGAR